MVTRSSIVVRSAARLAWLLGSWSRWFQVVVMTVSPFDGVIGVPVGTGAAGIGGCLGSTPQSRGRKRAGLSAG